VKAVGKTKTRSLRNCWLLNFPRDLCFKWFASLQCNFSNSNLGSKPRLKRLNILLNPMFSKEFTLYNELKNRRILTGRLYYPLKLELQVRTYYD